MSSCHPKLRAAFIYPDGDGGWVLKVLPEDGGQLVLQLDLKTAARLTAEAARVVADLAGKSGGA